MPPPFFRPDPSHPHWPPHRWGRGPGAARGAWRGRPGFIFFRFLFGFGFLALLFTSVIAIPILLLIRGQDWTAGSAGLWWLFGCVFVFGLAGSLGWGGTRAFRRIAMPLGNLMDAADAVADGDLSIRVVERGSPEFSQLARSFNRMVTELERADQQRRNLTADVAHELRTPLHIIQGNLEGILDGVYESTPEHLEATLDETRALARLVEDLRLLSLAEAGQLTLVKELVDVAEFLADVQTSFGGAAEAAGVDLRVETTADLKISADPGRLDQVIGNLVSNALRHTPRGGRIVLAAESTPRGVVLFISDTGEGISPEDLPFVFDRFWRRDRSRTRSEGTGSGLGLAIARQLVQAHGGRIEVNSTPGIETRFMIVLPVN